MRVVDTSPEISFVDVEVTFDRGSPALRELSATIAPGEIVAVVGPSGCGKSTLLRLVPRLIEPSVGQVSIRGNLDASPPSRIGFVFSG